MADNETIANDFDAKLYMLIADAEYQSRYGYYANRAAWSEVAAKLRAARGEVRSMMSERDRAATI